jgi:inward rectifier potassium channel
MSTTPPPTPSTTVTAQSLGGAQVEILGMPRKPWRDIYPSLLAMKWRYLLGLIVGTYFLANALFGLLYWLDPGGIENAEPSSYRDAFFFSVQTWATIGYGKMAPVHTFSNAVVTVEALTSMLSVAMTTGLLFAKFSRPTARVMFSQVAVITEWDGEQSLMLRLANERGTQMVDAKLTLVINMSTPMGDGGVVRRFHDLKLTRSTNPNFLFAWTVVHVIDEESPLWGKTAEEMRSADAFMQASLVGIDEVFNQTVYARQSYRMEDLRWGHDFVPMIGKSPTGKRLIDYTHFHDTTPEEVELEAAPKAG